MVVTLESMQFVIVLGCSGIVPEAPAALTPYGDHLGPVQPLLEGLFHTFG
ncbi:hypothetical protein Peur_047720 [Populus x canadensis]